MSNSRFGDWANRNGSRGGHSPTMAPAAAPAAPAAMPAPPAGYTWVMQPGIGLVLMPLAALMPTPPPPAPPQYQQPQYAPAPQYAPPVSYIPQPAPIAPQYPSPAAPVALPSPVQSCMLVKGDGNDPFAVLMSGVRDLVPPSSYDATQGRPSPETLAAVSGVPEFQMAMSQQQTPFAAMSAPRARGAELGSVPVPNPDAPPPASAAPPVPIQPPPMAPQLDGPLTPAGTRPMN